MIKMIESSFVFKMFLIACEFFKRTFENSFLINIFITPNNGEMKFKGSFVYKIYYGIRNFILNIFLKLKLDKAFNGSIFKIEFLWMALTVVFSPFIPTMLAILLSIAGFLSIALNLFTDKDYQLKYTNINKYIYLYALIYGCAIITSVDVGSSLFGGITSICFMLFSVVVINAIKTKKQVHILMFSMVFGGALVSLYGFYQYMFPAQFAGNWVDVDMFDDMFRVYSTYGNPNVLGEYFLLIIPISVSGFFIYKHIIAKLFFLGSTAVMMLCLLLTYSRGCYIGILVAAAVFAVLLDRRFILLGIVILIILPFVLPESIMVRFLSIGNMEDSSTSYRVAIWFGTIAMLKDYFISGVGPGEGAYNVVYPIYAYNGISAPHAHNTFLQVTCDSGVLGLVVFIVIIYQYFKETFISYLNSKNRTEKILTIGVISSIVGFLVQSLFDYTFYNYRITLLFWAFVGLGIVFSNYSKLKEA